MLVNEGGGTNTNLGDNALKQLASLSIRRHATALGSAGAACLAGFRKVDYVVKTTDDVVKV